MIRGKLERFATKVEYALLESHETSCGKEAFPAKIQRSDLVVIQTPIADEMSPLSLIWALRHWTSKV